MWINGLSPAPLHAPTTASIDEVLAIIYKPQRYRRTHDDVVTHYKVLDRRQIRVEPNKEHELTAVLLETNLGKWIVLMRAREHDWYYRELSID